MNSYTLNNTCPFCNTKQGEIVATKNKEHKIPSKGQVLICKKCAEILVFTENLNLIKPPEIVLKDIIKENPSILKWQEIIRKNNG